MSSMRSTPSTYFRKMDLMLLGVVTTMPRDCFACWNLDKTSLSISVERSQLKQKICFCTTHEKVPRRMVRVKSSNAGGTTWITRLRLSASIKARSGPTTVVLPAPMIICFTIDLFCKMLVWISSMSWRWRERNTRFHVNSKIKKRGSKEKSSAM